ncbi:MAG: hypothetical protein IJF74_00925 [Clostridia bacterium]|nr:hypothetical protein [Clostridia bacterium]
MREKLKAFLLTYWGAALFALITADAAIFYWYAGVYMRHRILFPVFLALACVFAVIAYKLFIFLWRNKWRDKVGAVARRLYAKYGARLFAALEKWGFGSGSELGGRSSIVFNFGKEKAASKKKRPPKWKNLRSDKQRLGFLYREVITKRINKGERILASETPAVIKDRLQAEGAEEEILEMYCGMRYSTLSPDGEEIDRLKREIEA